jgi:hypothetical protein
MDLEDMFDDIVDDFTEFNPGKAVLALVLGSASIFIYYFLTTLVIGNMDLNAGDAAEVLALFQTLEGYYSSPIHWGIGGVVFVLIAYRTPWLVLFISGIAGIATSFIAYMFFYHVALYYGAPVFIWILVELIIGALKSADL